MSAAPPFALPGYEWDGKRFYKATPTSSTSSNSLNNSLKSSSNKRSKPALPPSERKERQKMLGRKGLYEDLRDLALLEWGNKGVSSGFNHGIESNSLSRYELQQTIYPECLPMEEEIVKLSFDEMRPETIRLGGSSGTIATGDLNRNESENGFGGYYPNDDFGFRSNWFAPNKITSLNTSRNRVIATCLGPPAQAIVGTTMNTISLASVTLSPRKTSLWTSAISPHLLALGCDKKVLISSSPENDSPMEGIQTGGKNGDGTIFSLDLHEDLIFAGLRRGAMRIYDRRASHPKKRNRDDESQSKNDIEITIDCPVTNIKLLREDPNKVILAGMNGCAYLCLSPSEVLRLMVRKAYSSIGIYDLRFPTSSSTSSHSSSKTSSSTSRPSSTLRPSSTPTVSLKGHVNSFSTDLGFDTHKDEFLIAAGQDHRLRLWSLRTGLEILAPRSSSSTSSSSHRAPIESFSPQILSALSSLPSESRAASSRSPWSKLFESPIKTVRFSELDSPSNETRKGRRRELEAREGGGRGGGSLRSIWVGHGAGIEVYGFG
ncbi:hypothetical protein JCM5353_007762 [Sporobolomyces roseus]